ncbi:MAG: Cof-type HAD-IIB family hydrolase [Oscillospiraceae bacterium]
MTIKDLILVSDLDGTIIPETGIISRKNIEAIEKFCKLGGTFTIATGRSPIQAKGFLKEMGINGPMIANNGAVIYDPKTDENLWIKNFDKSYKEVLLDVKKQFPHIGIVAISGKDKYDVISNNSIVEEYSRMCQAVYHNNVNGELPDDCCKVLFAIAESDLSEVSTYLLSKEYDNVAFVLSGGNCFEMMPIGVSKGYPFERLIQIFGKKLENSVAIGDYNNDIEMIEKAGIGVAVENALDNVKAVANLVVKSCEDDGLADLIEYLINNIDKI